MSAMQRPNTQSPSVRRRIRDAICTLLCRPTSPPSPLQDTHDLPPGPEPRPNPAPESTTPAVLVEGDLVAESSAHEPPGEPSAEESSTESLSSSKPLEDAAISAPEGTDTALDPASTDSTLSTPTHEGLVTVLPPSNPPTPPPGSTLSVDALAPASNTAADDDSDVQFQTQPSHPVDSSPDDAHNHPFETAQEHPANISSAASSILSPAAPATPVVPDVEDPDSQPTITKQENSLNEENETQGQLYLTSIVITLNVASDENTLPLHLTALCLLGVGGSQEGTCIPLAENSPQAWTLNELIVLPLGACGMYCIAKDKEGDDIGFVYLKQEDLWTSGVSTQLFVTHDSQLSLFMSWKIVHDVTQSAGVDHLQACGMDTVIGDLLDNPRIDPAMLNHLLEGSRVQQENLEIGTFLDYGSEGSRLAHRFRSTGHLDDINGSIAAFQSAAESTPEGHAALPGMLNNLGNSFQRRFEHTGDMTDIAQAIATQQRAVQLTPQHHADLPSMLSNLGTSFLCHFERTGDMTDIVQAIAVQQRAVQLTPQHHADLPSMLSNLGTSFLRHFERTGDMTDIVQAIAAQQRAVQLTPQGHADLPGMLNNLGYSFRQCFKRTGDMTDIAQAIAAQQRAVQLTPQGHAGLPGRLNNLGSSFQSRFERTADMNDIGQAIAARQRAVQLTPQGHVGLPDMLNNLGTSFQSRFKHTGDMTDIAQAIAAQQSAVQLTPQGHANLPAMLDNLGTSFQSRFERTGDMTDIAQAIATQQRAVQLTPQGHVGLPGMLNNLDISFQSRFEHTGDMTDIAQAIAAQQRAVQLTPQGHANLPAMLDNLGTSFQRRFQCTGDMTDIAQAIAAHQSAVQLTPQGHANLPGRLNNLGTSFQSRFKRTADMNDIAQAIAVQERAVQLTPQGHTGLPSRLNNLGSSFQSRFRHTGDMTNIAQAIAVQQRAVQLTPQGHVGLPGMLNNLGNSFLRRFEYTGDMTDIAQATAAQERAVQLTPQGHASLPNLLNNLGTSFLCCFERTGDMTNIAQAIAALQRAVQLTPEGHADLPSRLINLGKSLQYRFEHAKSNGIGEQECLEDMHASVNCFRASAEDTAGAPTTCLQAAISWARLINHHHPESPDALIPFDTAIRLLTLVAGLEQTLEGRYGQLQRVTGIALEAAAAACRLGYPDKAVEWLEQGRCLVWGQLTGLRTPMDDLQKRAPQLAQRLTDVAKQLEIAGSSRTAIHPLMEMSTKISLEAEARSHSALAREWEELLLTARNIPGFESFLLPSSCLALLQNLPESGPIIVINSHEDGCDALALLHGSDQPLHIPLPNFCLKKADHYRHVLKNQLHSNWVRMREEMGHMDKKLEGTQERDMTQDWPDGTMACDGSDAAVNGVLQSLWLEVAKPILDVLAYSKYDTSSTPPRIWWCPTGVMSFLPIHAAGIYGGANPECLMDYVVSSYTPTITAITDRVKSSHSINKTASGLFLTSQPKAPSAAVIAGTVKEVNEVHAKAMEKGVRALKHEGDEISVEDCRSYMEEFSCVHLACHASQNASHPLQSRFLLHKGQLSLLSIIQMNLKNADLAFLSACQTSTGEEKLSDEAVHLAAGMLAAGYRRIVATMWSIDDGHAPRVATDFYDYLWSNRVDVTGVDGSLSAHALHNAVQQLRRRLGNSEKDLLTWVPYVHFGY